jgi:hypothetical protein
MMNSKVSLPDAHPQSGRARNFSGWLSAILLLALLPLPAVAKQYVMKMTTATYPATTPFGTDTQLGDDGFYPSSGQGLNIGFNFPFYCTTYSRIYIDTNGFITLGNKPNGSGWDDTDNYTFPLTDQAWPDTNPEFYGIPMIAPFWSDAITQYATTQTDPNLIPPVYGKVWYRLDTSTTPKKLVVTWDNVYHWYGYWCADPPVCSNNGPWGNPNTTGDNFQLVLYEDGRIQFTYGSMGWTGADTFYGTEATVGIYSGDISSTSSCLNGATPSNVFFPHDTNVAGKQLTYLLDSDNDNIADDGDASGVKGDHFCTHLASPPTSPYNPPVTVNCDDNCPNVANPSQDNNDGDGFGDACDTDDDNDTVPDVSDNCQFVANTNQANSDGDSFGDACDNCPMVTNQDQLDTDHDGIGDACDSDKDNDGISNAADNCPLVANANQNDYDGDGLGDVCDPDADNDGLLNSEETNSNWLDADTDNDNYTDYEEYWHNGVAGYQQPPYVNRDTNPNNPDTDYDGLLDGDEVHLYGTDPLKADTNGNGIDDGHEDFDGDGIINILDPFPFVANAPDGDINNSGSVDAGDIVVVTRIVLGLLVPDTTDYQHLDVYPPGAPDGKIDMSDLLLMMQMALH